MLGHHATPVIGIVDGQPDTVSPIQMVLELEGYAVVTADCQPADGANAVQTLCEQYQPHVLIWHIASPIGLHFQQVLRLSAAIGFPRPVNLFTSSDPKALATLLKSALHDAVIPLPLDIDQFVLQINRALQEAARRMSATLIH